MLSRAITLGVTAELLKQAHKNFTELGMEKEADLLVQPIGSALLHAAAAGGETFDRPGTS